MPLQLNLSSIINAHKKTILICCYLLCMGEFTLANPPDWEPPTNLQYNMQVVAQLQLLDETISFNENDLIAAFVAGECRGIASPLPDVNGLIFLSIGSNNPSGEPISFKAYLAEEEDIVNLNESFEFENQGEIGEYLDPLLFTINPDSPVYHIISASAGNHGSIFPNGEIELESGSNQLFEFSPEAGYEVENVMINGESIGTPEFYEFINVTSDQSIHVTFALISFLADHTSDAFRYRAYPNPFTHAFTIRFEGEYPAGQNLRMQITDETGRILITQTLEQAKQLISLTGKTAGSYFLHLFDEERLIHTQKLIKMNP